MYAYNSFIEILERYFPVLNDKIDREMLNIDQKYYVALRNLKAMVRH